MVDFRPRKIIGHWREGHALDLHTLGSVFIGNDDLGHPRFETTRTAMGELLYRLKYSGDRSVVPEIASAAERFLRGWNPRVDIVVPVPPSTERAVRPVHVLAEAISGRLGIPLVECVRRTREAPQLKDVFDLDERLRLLEGLHAVDRSATDSKRVLLFDDLYRSGATMNAIAACLQRDGGAAEVFTLTVTRTRSNH